MAKPPLPTLTRRINHALATLAVLTGIASLPFLARAEEPIPPIPPAPPSWSVLEDADQDGIKDNDEILWGLDPLDPADGLSDLDGDGLSLAWEFYLGTNPNVADTDTDGWNDSEEYLLYGTNPLDPLSFPPSGTRDSGAGTALDNSIPAPEVTPPPPTPPPSLSNGDFSEVVIPTWRSMLTSKEYQGHGFEWGAGADTKWIPYVGSTIEVWKATDGERFVELDGSPGNYGIKQPIANAKAGGYVLAWRESGRNSTKAGADPYCVRVFYNNETGEVPIAQSSDFSGLDKLKWKDNALAFQITAAHIATAKEKNSPIFVAFIPTGTLNTYGTLIDKVRLAPVDIDDDIPATGVDEVSNTVLPDIKGYQNKFWIMAPAGNDIGGSIYKNAMKFTTLLGENSTLDITCSDATVTPASVKLDGTAAAEATWHGTASETGDKEPGFKFNGNAVDLPIGVKVMKRRTVKVAVWLIPRLRANGTVDQLLYKPTQKELDDFLNSVYQPQVNMAFDCDVIETPPFKFDIADGTDFGAPAETLVPENGYLDTNNKGVAEETTLRDQWNDDKANVNVYIVGGVLGIRNRVWIESIHQLVSTGNFSLGHTDITRRSIFLVSSIATSDLQGLLDAVVHEVGHVILGPGHPDEVVKGKNSKGEIEWVNGGVAPLNGTQQDIRLMCSGRKRKKDGTARLLVKAEWDEAHSWCLSETKGDRMTP